MSIIPPGFVNVEFRPIIPLKANEINYEGSIFNCNNCQQGGGVCCRTAGCEPICEQCYNCSCQGKGNSQCARNAFCIGICAPGLVGDCPCSGRTDNATVFEVQPKVEMLPCDQAVPMANNLSLQVLNRQAIKTQCNTTTRLQCCQGSTSVNEGVCGPFWGPTNQGSCDQIMTDFCVANPGSKLCACLINALPTPECSAKDCRLTNAMKLSNQIKNQCLGASLTCIQFFNLSPNAKDNVVDRVSLNQTCNLSTNGAIAGTPTSDSGIATTIGLVVGVVAVVIVAITIGLVYGLKKKPKVQ